MAGKSGFLDSIKNLYNDIFNQRAATGQNAVVSSRVTFPELRAIYKTGLPSKIVRIKAGYALKDTLQFETEADRTYYKNRLEKHVKNAARFMVGFGRGIVVLYEPGEADLSEPRRKPFNPDTVQIKVFSGDLVTGVSPSLDLLDERYYKPRFYSVRGYHFHYSRVIDFTYVEPPEFDLPEYQYGGISEFELVYTQLVNDGIVERASPTILEKNSTLFYKVKGLRQAMQDGNEQHIRKYFKNVEDGRSVYGAGLLDQDDEAYTVEQTLTNLADADMITLRRLAMVTGIPLAMLIGENVKGLNSTGENEMQVMQDMIETLQSDYLESPINQLFAAVGMNRVEFKDNQGRTPEDRVAFEQTAIQNAALLDQMGEDSGAYLREHDVITEDPFDKMFPQPKEEADLDEPDTGDLDLSALLPGGGEGEQ